jgi:hypothetical protein
MTARHPTSSSRPRIGILAILLSALFLVAGSNSSSRSNGSIAPADPMPVAETTATAEAQPVDDDTQYRTLALGTWQDEYKGKRTMHLHEDGTGTMVVELSGLTAKLFASRLEFDMVWSIEDGRMKKQTVGGRPEVKVKAILAMMGDRVDEPILELSEERLLLLDGDGKTRYDWRRAEAE